MAKKIYLIGNWKMNPDTLGGALSLARAFKKIAGGNRETSLGLAVPSVFLNPVARVFSKKGPVGAQDVHYEKQGAFTGEISARQARSAGATFTILGHSERRARGENSEIINRKVTLAVEAGLKVILCIGEKNRDRDGKFLSEIKHEVLESLRGYPKKKLRSLVIVYEPVWAIGEKAKSSATPHESFEVATAIKRTLVDRFGKSSESVPILYGGSVDEKNAVAFLKEGGVDGLLMGRESLRAEAVGRIMQSL